MKELFIPFNIPKFEEIQTELKNAIDHDYSKNLTPYAFTYPESYMQEKCPVFASWLLPRLKLPVRLYRYYVTPPRQVLNVHIDGIIPSVPFGLNIPIAGTEGTFHNIYNCERANYKMSDPNDPNYLPAIYPKDLSKLELVESLEIKRPYVINNSVMHGVVNDTDNYRVMFTIRWMIHLSKARDVYECMDTTEMF